MKADSCSSEGRETHTPPRFKVCCIASVAEAMVAVSHGAWAIGLVSEMPSGPGVIPEALIGEIAASVPSEVATFLLTSSRHADAIIAQQHRCGVNTIQLCDRPAPRVMKQLRDALPGVQLVQVIHVIDESAIEEASHAASTADALLLDSGNPDKAIKELGGTGRVHDWSLSRQIREDVDVPVILAGGLTPENVATAVREVSPFGVDVCSGLRSGGRLDEDKLIRFVRALDRAG